MRTYSAALALVAVLPLLGSCQVAPGTGRSSFNVVSAEEEAKIGADNHPQILSEFGGAYDDPKIQAYVAGIGKRLLANTETPGASFHFTVLNSPIVNAMALPGGYVYVNRGVMLLADDEAELAGVMGHEIGHVTGRHTAQRMSQSMAANVATGLLGAVASAVTGVSGVGNLAGVAATAYIQGYSRDQESEADGLGIRYMNASGWDPDAMATFLAKLREQSRLDAIRAGRSPDSVDEFSLFGTHPRALERVKDAAKEVAKTGHDGVLGHDQYLARIEGMIVDDDPNEGVIRGRVFSHPAMGIRFEVPSGFRLANSATAVNAGHSDGSLIRFDTGPEAHGDMTNYIQSQWAKGARLSNIESITVNGMPAAAAAAQINTNKGTMNGRLVAIKDGKTVYRMMFLTPPSLGSSHAEDFRRTTYSLQHLSEAEKADFKPLRVKIITVKAGDTVDSLAQKLPYEDHKVERFRVLNGLFDGKEVKPGQKLKTIM
jgi:predicted Zn-dependent protease